MNTNKIVLYHFPTSSCSEKVRVALAEKKLDWQSIVVNLLRFEQLKPSYMQLNPEGVVPTLKHGDKIICDSPVIVKYIEATFPQPSLIPTTDDKLELMNLWFEKAENFPLRELSFSRNNVLLLKFMKKRILPMKIPILERLCRNSSNNQLKHDYLERINDQKKVNSIIYNPEQISDLYQQAEQLIIELEQHMQDRKFICNEKFSLADIMWMIILHRFKFLHLDIFWKHNKSPAVDNYFKRLKSRPSFSLGITRYFRPWVMIPLVLAALFKGPAV